MKAPLMAEKKDVFLCIWGSETGAGLNRSSVGPAGLAGLLPMPSLCEAVFLSTGGVTAWLESVASADTRRSGLDKARGVVKPSSSTASKAAVAATGCADASGNGKGKD